MLSSGSEFNSKEHILQMGKLNLRTHLSVIEENYVGKQYK
jgi:hypothetical protein